MANLIDGNDKPVHNPRFEVRKDFFNGTARPWLADFVFADGTKEVAFCWNFPTKKALVAHLQCISGNHTIVRVADR